MIVMIVLCCVVLYDFVHCLLLRRNNKYIYISTRFKNYRIDDHKRTRLKAIHLAR